MTIQGNLSERNFPGCRTLGAFCALCFAVASPSATAAERLAVSFQTSQSLSGELFNRQSILHVNADNYMSRAELNIPPSTPIAAITEDGEGILFVAATTFASGGITFTPRDIVRQLPNGALQLAYSGDDLGITTPTKIAAIAHDQGKIYFALDTWAALGIGAIAPNDILVLENGNVTVFKRGEDMALPLDTRIQDLSVIGGNFVYLAFATSFETPAHAFKRGAIWKYDLSADSWRLTFDLNRSGIGCTPCAISAFDAQPDLNVIFRDRYED